MAGIYLTEKEEKILAAIESREIVPPTRSAVVRYALHVLAEKEGIEVE